MIYGGPALPGRILRGLSRLVEATHSIAALRDSKLEHWAAKSLQ